MINQRSFTIFGYGIMGAAMAHHLFSQGHHVTIIPSPYDIKDDIPANFSNNENTSAQKPILVLATNTSGLDWALNHIKQHYQSNQHDLLILTKGLICRKNKIITCSELIQDMFEFKSVSCISGPCIANEMLQNEPTAVNLSSTNANVARQLANDLSTLHYRVHPNIDVIGSEWCSALKNIYALIITATSAFAFNTQENFNAALFHAIHQELSHLSRYVGGDASTAFSLSGLGDIWVTCRKGRNGQFGHHWGSGQFAPSYIKSKLFANTTIEGYQLARNIHHVWLTQTQYSQFFYISSVIQAIANDRPFTSLYKIMERQLMLAT